MECWGSLVLRIPAFGGMTLKGLEVHRITVGESGGGGMGEEGGHDGVTAMTSPLGTYPMKAQVSGFSTVVEPGESGLAAGTQVQVKITLKDNGPNLYTDTVNIAVNRFMGEGVWENVYTSGMQTIQQVQIHELDD